MVVVAVTESVFEVLPAEPVDELARLVARCAAVEAENEGLWSEVSRLLGENDRLAGRVEVLAGQLEEARRVARRQAAPFSRGKPSGGSATAGPAIG